MSTQIKGMPRVKFIRMCVRGGAVYVDNKRSRGGEYRLIFPNGERINGSNHRKDVGKVAIAAARRNGIL